MVDKPSLSLSTPASDQMAVGFSLLMIGQEGGANFLDSLNEVKLFKSRLFSLLDSGGLQKKSLDFFTPRSDSPVTSLYDIHSLSSKQAMRMLKVAILI